MMKSDFMNIFKHGYQMYFTMINVLPRIFKDVFEFEPYLTLLPERLRIVKKN